MCCYYLRKEILYKLNITIDRCFQVTSKASKKCKLQCAGAKFTAPPFVYSISFMHTFFSFSEDQVVVNYVTASNYYFSSNRKCAKFHGATQKHSTLEIRFYSRRYTLCWWSNISWRASRGRQRSKRKARKNRGGEGDTRRVSIDRTSWI